jgi:SAM-dependent methyltransferase
MSVEAFSNIIKDHVAKSRSANTHPAKLLVLSSLLKELFGVGLEELIPGIETKLGSKLWGLRGSADLIFSNVVFEIKVDLKAEAADAEQKLMKYFQVLHAREPDRKHVGIATDVIDFVAYMPAIESGRVVGLNKIGAINIAEASASESVLWLDSFVFSKPKIRPSAMDLRWRFGPESPTYCVAIDGFTALWNEVKDEKDVALKLDLWTRNMEIVYGSKPELSSFIDHTYLVTLVKLIVYLRLSGDNVIREDRIRRALTGEYFSSYGISNLIEEDFFTWILNPKIADKTLRLVCDIARELLRYDFSQVDEDFFKEIYQEIVERGERHRIGEYYTPEWLVQLTLREAVNLWRERNQGFPRILDPACGSGTFLCNAIHMAREELQKSGTLPDQVLEFIVSNIVGVDVNPLATIIARANYLIALGNLLQLGKPIIIPVYVADSIRLPRVLQTIAEGVNVYEYEFDGHRIQMPMTVAEDRGNLGLTIEALRDALNLYTSNVGRDVMFSVLKATLSSVLTKNEIEVLKHTLNEILDLMDKGLDSIWVFILSNIYAPIALSESKFDMVVGNPPWIAMRFIENKQYQTFFKQQVSEYKLMDKKQTHLLSNMEMATVFFCRTSDLYLKDEGIVAFVMPRSVLTGAFHHINFKYFKKPTMKLYKILDLEDVTPLFNVPSCVLIAKKGDITKYPVLARKYSGRLDEKNARLHEAIRQLSANDYMYEPPTITAERSHYHDQVREGAYLFPASFWFIEFDVHPTLGINTSKPTVKTSREVAERAKERWRGIELKGNVEADFIYATLLSYDVIPFGYTKLRPVVLPIEPTRSGYRVLDANSLKSRGFIYMANWLEKAQDFWKNKRTKIAEGRFPRLLDRLDYNGLLSIQNPSKRFITLYNRSGTNIASCVIDRQSLPKFSILKAEIEPKGFIPSNVLYLYETSDEEEAHYLCALLNSNIVNNAIKPLQPRGAFGERGIHRRPFMLPIPKFNRNNQLHMRLVKLSKECHVKVASIRFTKKSAAGLRKESREALKEEIAEIDKFVSQLLGL